MRLIRTVHARRWNVAPSREPLCAHVGDRRLARRHERVHRRHRGRVVNDAFEGVGQADQPPEPRERDGFEFGGGGRGPPQHRLLIERGRQEIGEHAGRAAGDGEIGEEPRMIPVRQAGDEQAFEVGHDGLERFTLFGRVRRQGGCDRAGPIARKYRIVLDVLEVVGDPVDELVTVTPERRRVHR